MYVQATKIVNDFTIRNSTLLRVLFLNLLNRSWLAKEGCGCETWTRITDMLPQYEESLAPFYRLQKRHFPPSSPSRHSMHSMPKVEGGKRGREILTCGKKDVAYSRDFSKVPTDSNLMKWLELSGVFGISLNKSYKYNPAALSRPSYSVSAAATSLFKC